MGVDVNGVEARCGDLRHRGAELVERHREIGPDEGEHRRHVRVNHPRALAHASEHAADVAPARLLGERVGGLDRREERAPGLDLVGELGERAIDPGDHAIHR